MKRFLKISAVVAGVLLACLLAALLLLQSPRVQTMAVRRVIAMLSDKIAGDISIGKIHVRPFDAVVLKDVCIVDRNPYVKEGVAPADTMARASLITAKFRAATLLRSGVVDISEIYVSDGFFTVTSEPDHHSNTQRIFSPEPKPKQKKEIRDKEILRVGKAEIDGFRFRLLNYNPPKKELFIPDDAIDWADLDVRDIHLKAHDVRMHGLTIEGVADDLSFREKSGIVFYRISGDATVIGAQSVHVRNLKLRDMYSDIRLDEFRMTFDGMPALSHFIEEVRLDGHIRDSRVDFRTLGYFAPTLKRMSIAADVQGEVHGTISDLAVKDFRFKTPDGVSADVNGTLTGLPDAEHMVLDYRIDGLRFTLAGLERFIRGWAPDVHIGLENFAKKETFTFAGTARGPINRLAVNGQFRSGAGRISTGIDLRNLTDPKRPIRIGGQVRTQDLDLGRITGVEALGPLTLATQVQATLDGPSPTVAIDSLSISQLHALGYDYTGIAAAGTYSGDAFDGRIVCSDPNLNFLFQGIFTLSPKTRNAVYKFYANLGYADLNAIHLDKRGTSRLSLRTTANFNRIEEGDLIGNIDIRDVQLTDTHGFHDIGDITIVSHINDDINRIRLDSKFLEATYVGSAFVTEFIRDLQDVSTLRELPSLFHAQAHPWAGNRYDLHFQTHDTREILAFIKQGIYIADSTDLRLSIGRDGLLTGELLSQRIALREKYLKDLKLTFDNADGNLSGTLESGELNFPPLHTRNNRLYFLAEKDRLGLGFTFDNETETANKGEFYLSGDIGRSARDSLLLHAEILPSSLYINGDPWTVNGSGIGLYGPDLRIGSLDFTSGGQEIHLEGGYSSEHADTLRLNLQQFDVSALNPLLGDLGIDGLATGRIRLASPLKDRIGLLLDLRVEDTYIGKAPLGSLRLASIWDDARNGFRALVRNELNGVRNLDVSAFLSPSGKTAEGQALFNRLNLAYAAPVLRTVFSETGGYLSGGVAFSGPLNALELESDALRLEEALLKVDFTQVPYTASGPLRLNASGLAFDNVNLYDRFGAQGRLNGKIGWDHFKDMYMDLHIDMNQMEVLDLPEGANPTFYGQAFATGRADITGPLSSLLLEVDAATAKEGDFHVPLASGGDIASSNLLTFKEPVTNTQIDPYDLMMHSLDEDGQKASDLTVKLHIRPNTAMQALIELDKASGNVLSARGNGQIDVEVRPSVSLFTINGNYTLTDGLFHFSAMNLASRDFNIQDGSSIKFNGDIMDSDLNINALYRTKASIGTLIADTTSVSTRRTVDCGIGITDKIRNPRISFSITVPDLDPTTQARVENALNSEDKVQKQFLALLISGGFLPDEQSGIVNNSSVLTSTVTEIMASQLSGILQKLDIPIDLGVDYQQTGSGNDLFDVAVSTELFNNRVIVNGTIGNRQYGTASSGQEVVGDLDIEIKLDKPGALRLRLFSHSADQYTNYLDRLQRNGVGLTYQKEYNNFWEFLRNLFSRRRRDQATLDALRRQETNRIRIGAEGIPAEAGTTEDRMNRSAPEETETPTAETAMKTETE